MRTHNGLDFGSIARPMSKILRPLTRPHATTRVSSTSLSSFRAASPRPLLIRPRASAIRSSTSSSAAAALSWSVTTAGESGRIVASAGPLRRLQQVAGHVSAAARGGIRAMAGASGPELSKVEIKRNGDGETVFSAYVAGSKGAPGIVVIQEWWGVDYEIKNHANAIAAKGFRALIPDLYRGKLGKDAEEATHLFQNLDWPAAIKDIAAAVKYLKDEGSQKIGATGFCMGGALSLASGVLVPGIDAVVAFYGTPSPELADVSKVKIPVQAHFGELDNVKGFADIETAKGLEENLKKAGVPSDVYIYPGVGHAFMNSSDEGIDRKKAVGFGDHSQGTVDLAWSRFDAWFNKYLNS